MAGSAKIGLSWSRVHFSYPFEKFGIHRILGRSTPLLRRKLGEIGGQIDLLTHRPQFTRERSTRGLYLGEFLQALKMLETSISGREERVKVENVKHLNDPDYEQKWLTLLSKARAARVRTKADHLVHRFEFSVEHDPLSRHVIALEIYYVMTRIHRGNGTKVHTETFKWTSDIESIVPSFVAPIWYER